MSTSKQTINQTGDTGREHLYNINKQAQCPVSKHFNSVDHDGISDIAVTGILYASNAHDRIYMENRFIKRFRTLAPSGLNQIHKLLNRRIFFSSCGFSCNF